MALARYRGDARSCARPVGAGARHFGSTHEGTLALARDHGLSIYDALIVVSAIEAGCDILYTEDMQHGRTIGDLAIVNPFLASAP